MINVRNHRQIIWGFITFAVVFFLYSEGVVNAVSKLSPIMILILAPFLNPIYLIFIFALYKDYGFKGSIAGFLLAVSTTLISMPHLVTKTGDVVKDTYINLIPDMNFWNLIPDFLKFNIMGVNFASALMYLGLSTLLVVLALMITNKKSFKAIFLKSV